MHAAVHAQVVPVVEPLAGSARKRMEAAAPLRRDEPAGRGRGRPRHHRPRRAHRSDEQGEPYAIGPRVTYYFYRDILAQADIVFAGDNEAAIAVGAGTDPADLAERIAAYGPRQVIIELGGEGAVALIDGELFHQAAVPIDALDTVGAGDAFVAGYLAELVLGRLPGERLETAGRTGAFACLVPGGWEGFPRRHELGILDARESVIR